MVATPVRETTRAVNGTGGAASAPRTGPAQREYMIYAPVEVLLGADTTRWHPGHVTATRKKPTPDCPERVRYKVTLGTPVPTAADGADAPLEFYLPGDKDRIRPHADADPTKRRQGRARAAAMATSGASAPGPVQRPFAARDLVELIREGPDQAWRPGVVKKVYIAPTEQCPGRVRVTVAFEDAPDGALHARKRARLPPRTHAHAHARAHGHTHAHARAQACTHACSLACARTRAHTRACMGTRTRC